jgi:tetratricopeptide (TPR) repeat protein
MRPAKLFCLCAALALTALGLSGCAALVSKAASGFGENLSSAILNQDDPELVRAGMPSYILLLDSLLERNPDSPAILSAAGTMYASYGAVFADDPARAARLTTHARTYTLKGMCEIYADACGWRDMNYDDLVASLKGVKPEQADALYGCGFAMLAWLRAHSSDWGALAELPQAEALVRRYLELSGDSAKSSAHVYLGILLTLRPPSLGGKPEEAREHFEKAIALSGGRDLSAKVEYAKGYAKMVYDRDLYDRLVSEVLDASPYADGFTLMNVMAQKEALQLRAEADDYF